ncbi:MAG: RNA polymerase sigma factor [Crocinitomicaceae bacterium]|nr:RNA polymerase sigma factor [Crocinitomicaceae bacterium]
MIKSKQDHFLALYEPIHDRFERFCRARVYGEMEYTDLMNETLLVTFEKLDSLKSDDSFLSYLFSTAVRLLANSNRKMKPERMPSVEKEQGFPASDSTEHSIEVHLLHRALAELNNDQREALILFEISGFSIREIAGIQEASESAVKQRLKRGRERLAEILSFESEIKTGKEVS